MKKPSYDSLCISARADGGGSELLFISALDFTLSRSL